LEARSAVNKTEPIVFRLHEWVDRPPFREGVDDDPETLARMKAKALDRLIAAGKIEECDRHRVQFIVWVTNKPSRPEQLVPYVSVSD
jgi:hypothetical protein